MRGELFIRRLRHNPRPIKPLRFISYYIDAATNPLNTNPVIGYDPAQLALEEYHRTSDIFEDRIQKRFITDEQAAMIISALYMEIVQLEEPIVEQLEELGTRAIRELYNIPDELEMEAEIAHGPCGGFLDDSTFPQPELSPERMQYIEEQIQKRILLNSLVHGSSKHAWKTLHYLIKDELDALEPRLFGLYNQLTALTSMLLWRQKDLESMTVEKTNVIGACKVEFNDDGAMLTSRASCLPVLLCELNKSLFDYVICAGIPSDLSDEELMYYYSQADNYLLEPWMYFVGPSLWERLIIAARVTNPELPNFIARVSECTMDQLTILFQNLIDDKQEEAKENLKLLNLL